MFHLANLKIINETNRNFIGYFRIFVSRKENRKAMTEKSNILGIDLGGTNIRVGLVQRNTITQLRSAPTPANGTKEDVLQAIGLLIEGFSDTPVDAIGIGVPSVVDVQKGIVYNVVNIPSWKEVHLKDYLESRFHIPVFVNNDANCFAAGEKHYGKGKGYGSFVGLVLGTGLGAGIIINNRLYEGKNCGAGEIGCLPYLANNYEYYCSGQFFRDEYHVSAKDVYKSAVEGNANAIAIFRNFGTHIGNMLQAVLYAYDPEFIVLGGSVSNSYPLFIESMYKALSTFMYPKTLTFLKIEVSELENSAVYGAASLYNNHLVH